MPARGRTLNTGCRRSLSKPSVGQSEYAFCDDVELHFGTAARDRQRFAEQPRSRRLQFVLRKTVAFPTDAVRAEETDVRFGASRIEFGRIVFEDRRRER